MTHPTTAARDLYEAILREPRDDAHRLIYAEELDAAGECVRAEFIRLQCQIAEIESRAEVKTGGLICLLKSRESDLLDFGFDEIPKGVKLTYRRGFVDSVAMTMQAFVGTECQLCREGHRQYGPYHERAVLSDSPLRPFDEPITPEMTFRRERCDGRGMFPGLASVICAKWPVTSVRFSDYHPTPHSGDYWIIDEEVCDMIPTIDRELVYATDDDAISALSNGAVNFGRQSVGLPLLIW